MQRPEAKSGNETNDPLVGKILDCVRSLLPLEELDDLIRSGVELARTKLGVERCALWLLDFDQASFRGTYGTDLAGNTTDEHAFHCSLKDLEAELPCKFQDLEGWSLRADHLRYTWTENGKVTEGSGWNTIIPIAGPEGNVGCFFQDSAITDKPIDPHLQDMMSLYCSLLGQLAGRRLAEGREMILSKGLEEVLAAADELLAYDNLDILHRRIVELARERLGVARAGLFVASPTSPTKFVGTWGTDWDGQTTQEHKGSVDLAGRPERISKLGLVYVENRRWTAFQPFRMSWFEPDGTRIDHAEGWNATHYLSVGDRTLALLFVDPGKTCEPLDPRKMDLLATYCALAARILDRRLAQEALRRSDAERLESLGVLAGGLAHDFNNLLAAILGSVELMLDTPDMDPIRTRKRLTDARDACLRGKSLAGQLLTFSRGGAPVRHPITTIPFIEEAVGSSVGTHALEWNILCSETPWNLLADEAQMGQVFQNLTVNACHWQPQGGTLRMGIRNCVLADGEHPSVSGGTYLQIDFIDGGPGIPDSLRKRIFDPYFTTRAGGSGLGLATCHSIVSRHGGSIESIPSHQGAHFRLLLPATEVGPTTLEAGRGGSTELGGLRFLVMDDEPVLRDMLRDMLETHHATVVTTEDGQQAVQAWIEAQRQNLPFHIGILDLTISGGMGGVEAAKRIKQGDPKARLLVCSGYSNDPFLSEPEKCGFCGVLPKPFRLAELMELISKSIA